MPEAEERIYEWDVARVADDGPPFVFEVTRERIADYCRAVRYENPVYLNDEAAEAAGFPGIVAPPTMLYTYAPQRRVDVINSRGYVTPEQAKDPRSTPFVSTVIYFQGGQVRPGDVITSVTRVQDKYERRGNKFITFRIVAHNQRQEKVAEYDYTCIWEYTKSQKVRVQPSGQQSKGG